MIHIACKITIFLLIVVHRIMTTMPIYRYHRIVLYYCAELHQGVEAQEKQKITHMQNLASKFTKLNEVKQLFEFF